MDIMYESVSATIDFFLLIDLDVHQSVVITQRERACVCVCVCVRMHSVADHSDDHCRSIGGQFIADPVVTIQISTLLAIDLKFVLSKYMRWSNVSYPDSVLYQNGH